MKKRYVNLIKCLVFLMILFVIVGFLAKISERKASFAKYEPFFEHADEFDVLFFGNSHVLNAVYPMELWDKYGIASYNLGGQDSYIPTNYWVMMNALDYCTPKMVVIDCIYTSKQEKSSIGFEFVHAPLDAFPLSVNKLKAAFDILDDPVFKKNEERNGGYEGEKRTRLGLLWDYYVYHYRWEELDSNDFNPAVNIEYGAETYPVVAIPATPEERPDDGELPDTVAAKYLGMMIEECQKRDIEVLLTFIPFPPYESTWMEADIAEAVAAKYGVKYINYLDMDLVDYDTDCADPQSHLNPMGAKKVTEHIGQVLTSEYDIKDHRAEEGYSHWNEDYKVYSGDRIKKLNKAADLNTLLMLLNAGEYEYTISSGDDKLFDDEITAKLLTGHEDDVTINVDGSDGTGSYSPGDGVTTVTVFDKDAADKILIEAKF